MGEDGDEEGHRSRQRTRRTALYSVVRVLALLPPIRAQQCTIYSPFRSDPFHLRLLFLSYPPPLLSPTPPHHAYAPITATTGSSTGSGCIVFASARKGGRERVSTTPYAADGRSAFTGGVNGTFPPTTTLPVRSSFFSSSAAGCGFDPSDPATGDVGDATFGGELILVISRTKDVPQNAAEYLVTYYVKRSAIAHIREITRRDQSDAE